MPMVISRTPLRMSFVGGGSDLPVYFKRYGGAVISTAIDKYVYVTVNKKFDDGIRVAYSQNEEVSSVAAIKHPLVRATMQMLGISGGSKSPPLPIFLRRERDWDHPVRSRLV
jgi:D-glycero-alpha-D-manno-heptose-7-phosphate kinase